MRYKSLRKRAIFLHFIYPVAELGDDTLSRRPMTLLGA